jgi:hypothetical protein
MLNQSTSSSSSLETDEGSNVQNEDINRDRNDDPDNEEADIAPQRRRRPNNASRPRGYFI